MSGLAAQTGRLWRTVRWLKAAQVWGRLRFRLQRPRPDLRAAPPLRAVSGPWATPPARQASLLGPTRLCFLAETHDLAEVGWDDPSTALLWRYNLHYFDDLNAAGALLRKPWQQRLVQRWCEENPPGMGTAWAPYPSSLRIVNWVKWLMAGQEPEAAWLHSLAVQARWLMQRLEWHLLGNHLFANAKALVYAGLFFEGQEADAWLAQGLAILQRELPEQILADGGQFERSPMYHALALEDVLDLLNLMAAFAGAAPPPHAQLRLVQAQLQQRSGAMSDWLRCMRHPSGALARFNDVAEGIAPDAPELERYAAALGISTATPESPLPDGITQLQPSGYVRAACGPAVAFLDVARIGPDYLPGHAHADTLSFELSVAGHELVVNRGTSVYGTGPRRLWERGTAAHSTVQMGGHDSSEVWSGFRVGRRARPGPVHVRSELAGLSVEGSHDGYAHLPARTHHHRHWHLQAQGLLVEDRLEPDPGEPAVAHFHFAPGLTLHRDTPTRWRVMAEDGERAQIDILTGDAQVMATRHALRFGTLVDATTLRVGLSAGRAALRFTWTS